MGTSGPIWGETGYFFRWCQLFEVMSGWPWLQYFIDSLCRDYQWVYSKSKTSVVNSKDNTCTVICWGQNVKPRAQFDLKTKLKSYIRGNLYILDILLLGILTTIWNYVIYPINFNKSAICCSQIILLVMNPIDLQAQDINKIKCCTKRSFFWLIYLWKC